MQAPIQGLHGKLMKERGAKWIPVAISTAMICASLSNMYPVSATDLEVQTPPAAGTGARKPRAIGTITVLDSVSDATEQASTKNLPSSANEKSYAASLQKEKQKQQSMKKTKEQRAKDLCEQLGRGC